ncbi:MAG TPA: DUF3307 domain-containing protein [Opitutaceae bacterium]
MLNLPGGRALFFVLLCAHLLGDFVFQTDQMVRVKRRPATLALHAAIHAALVFVLVGAPRLWPLAFAVLVIHALIDWAKLRFGPLLSPARAFWWDQALHIVSLFVLAGMGSDAALTAGWTTGQDVGLMRAMIAVSGFIVCVRVAAIAIGFWVQPYLDQLVSPGAEAMPSGRDRGLPNGGRIIGQWERALIFLFVFAGLPSGIGFLVAAKSVFRFGELSDRQNRMEAEYITIGTLMSFGVAIAVAYATQLLAL